ncbi:tryptophan synthase subunit alpha [soil metagenome]
MSRIREALAASRAEGRKAMGLFVTCGFPDVDATPDILSAMVEGGADFVELGMPFSDPLAEGIPIQRASERALNAGVDLATCLRTTETFRATHDVPLLLMGYVNPIMRYGAAAFCRDAAAAGADGLILPDLPPEEADLLSEHADEHGLGLTFLIAPNTREERVRLVDEQSTAFVYAVSISGLTGSGLADHEATAEYLLRARQAVSRNPLLVGFGIQTAEDAARLAEHTDGFIVGSAIINEIDRIWDGHDGLPSGRYDRLTTFVRNLLPSATPA